MRPEDEDRFCGLHQQWSRSLRRTAYLLCGDWHLAEDLVQTAYVRLYVAWPRLRSPEAALAFLRTTLTRAAIDHSRRPQRRERPSHRLPEIADQVVDTDTRHALRRALGQVPPRQRACLILRFYDDLSVQETAEILGCRPGTVKSQTARGLQALRSHPDHHQLLGDRG